MPRGLFRRNFFTLPDEISTIYALSSGKGKSGVAVVRISGPSTTSILQRLTQQPTLPRPRLASLRTIHDPVSGECLDKGIVLWFPGQYFLL